MLHFPHIDPIPYQGILIDLDNTLYPFEPPHQISMQACCTWLQKRLPELEQKAFDAAFYHIREQLTKQPLLQGACRSRSLIFTGMLKQWSIASPHNAAHHLEILYWETFLDNMQADPQAIAFLDKCLALKKPICVVTDMQHHWQMRKLIKLGIADKIDALITSESVGVEKPEPKIFQQALDILGIAAKDAVMIGDHREKDVIGAKKMGMDAYLVVIEDQ